MVGAEGIEPTSFRLKGGCNASVCYAPEMAPRMGVEPISSARQAGCTPGASRGKVEGEVRVELTSRASEALVLPLDDSPAKVV